jgi:hypothetical protein
LKRKTIAEKYKEDLIAHVEQQVQFDFKEHSDVPWIRRAAQGDREAQELLHYHYRVVNRKHQYHDPGGPRTPEQVRDAVTEMYALLRETEMYALLREQPEARQKALLNYFELKELLRDVTDDKAILGIQKTPTS